GTEQFKKAQAEDKLLRLPTGDGVALVFRNTPEAPALCAVEISKALKSHPELKVRMGIHSGPVNEILDLNEQSNIAGAGINIAQRLLSAIVADLTVVSKKSSTSTSLVPGKSIAVLPFENLSSDKENAYFTEGVQDEILTRLAKVAGLKVISRTSTQNFKSAPENLPQIAKQLGVMHILEGSVQKANDQVRVNVQ